jgi:hypothetical protein
MVVCGGRAGRAGGEGRGGSERRSGGGVPARVYSARARAAVMGVCDMSLHGAQDDEDRIGADDEGDVGRVDVNGDGSGMRTELRCSRRHGLRSAHHLLAEPRPSSHPGGPSVFVLGYSHVQHACISSRAMRIANAGLPPTRSIVTRSCLWPCSTRRRPPIPRAWLSNFYFGANGAVSSPHVLHDVFHARVAPRTYASEVPCGTAPIKFAA